MANRYDYGYRGRPRTCLWCGRPLKVVKRRKPGYQEAMRVLDEEYRNRVPAAYMAGSPEAERLYDERTAWYRREKRRIERTLTETVHYGVIGTMEKGFCSQWCGGLFAWRAVELGTRFRPLPPETDGDEEDT